MRWLVIAAVAVCTHALGAQSPATGHANLGDSVLADLARLSDLERAYFAANGQYTSDLNALNFKPVTSAVIAVSYASARTFSASASHARLAPFLCFVIASATDGPEPERPFCTNSRYGTAAAALARAGTAADSVDSVPPREMPEATAAPPHERNVAKKNVTPSVESPVARRPISPREFGARLRAAARTPADSAPFDVQFAVKDARYDPDRGVLEVAVERIPFVVSAADSVRPAIACYTQPAFACGASGLSYVARGLFRVPRRQAPSPEVLSGGLTMRARFVINRRSDASGTAVTLLALVLQANGEAIAHWERAAAP
ncbi:MAG TPA: hypothetical protein VN613_00065 [Gemmatimonadaceae bacterium]|nr:hypothetical protein [Gemmatimonadaceae bacterium]